MQRGRRPHPPDAPAKPASTVLSQTVFALALVVGLALGIALTRLHGPLRNDQAEPWQLREAERAHYMLAIALEYGQSGDSARALNKLIALRPAGDPLAALDAAACALGGRGYLASAGGIQALRSAVQLFQAFGREGCAERLLPELPSEPEPAAPQPAAVAATRATPLPTKAPLPATGRQTNLIIPTLPVQRSFAPHDARSFCDLARPAIIEVLIVDYLGRGIPGQRIRVRFGEREDIFISGLKTERGDAYADFQMAEGISYAIDMAGASQPLEASLSTGACFTDNRRGLKSWRVTFIET